MSNEGQTVAERLTYLRGEIEAERISYEELAELQQLGEAGFIDDDDVLLLEWAGVEEGSRDEYSDRRQSKGDHGSI